MKDINTNHHVIFGHNIAEEGDSLYKEYRKKWHDNPKDNVVGLSPLFLDVEISSGCNLRCPYCVQTRSNFKTEFMSFDLFKKIIDEASEIGVYGIKLNTIGRGEPTLHKNIVKFVQYAKKCGMIDVYFNTNATLLNTKFSYDLMKAGLDRISFSVDGYTKEVYEKNRVGANFDKVVNNIANFFYVRNMNQFDTKIRIQAVKLPGLNLKKFSEYWQFFADEISYLDFKEMYKREDIISDWACPQLYQRLSVLANGDITICNHDDRLFSVLGNIRDTTIVKIWNSSALKQIRNWHQQGNAHLIASCNGCALRTSEINKGY